MISTFSSLLNCMLLRLDGHGCVTYVSLGSLNILKIVNNSNFGRPSDFKRQSRFVCCVMLI